MISTLLKWGLSGYDVKQSFCAFQCEYLLQNPPFLRGKNFGGTRHLCEKINPPSIFWGGGVVNGKSCWLIAYKYMYCSIIQSCMHRDIVVSDSPEKIM